jgi:WD40 repeat protein
MSETTQAVEPQEVPEPSQPQGYDAFLSYTHRDRSVALGIQKGLHQIGRRLGQRRALRVFRADTDLTAHPEMWAKTIEVLDQCRFLIVVLSPEAGESVWVNRELGYWLENRGRDQLLLVLAGGRLQWDEHRQRFDPDLSDAAPPVLTEPGSLPAEPFYIDVSDDAPWDPRTAALRQKITALAAPIHGKPKDQLASDDLSAQQRFRRLRTAAITALALLTVIAVGAAVVAAGQWQHAIARRQEAIRQRDQAIALRLTSEAADMLAQKRSGGDVRAFQELLAARALTGSPDDGALLHAADIRADSMKIIPTGAPVRAVAFSPDSRRVATAEGDHTARLWDADTGKLLHTLTGHTDMVLGVAFSPDGHRLASGSSDKSVRLWDADTGQPMRTLSGHTDIVTSVAFSPDGHRVASGSADHTTRLWNADTGQPLRMLSGHTAMVMSVAFSPDGHRLASGSADHTTRLWNADTGQPLGDPLTGHSDDIVFGVAFSPDGQRLATASAGQIQLWNADTGQPLGDPLTGHTEEVFGVAFSPDGSRLASASRDNTVRFWNADPSAPPPHALGAALAGHQGWVLSLAYSPDGQRVASGGADGTVRIWDSRRILVAHTPLAVKFSPDGQRLIGAGGEGEGQLIIWLWSADTGYPIGSPVVIHADDVHTSPFLADVALSPDGRRLATAVNNNAVRLWDTDTGQPLGDPLTGHTAEVNGVAFSPDGHRLATASADHTARLWNADTGQPLGDPLTGHTNAVNSVAFSPDGHRLATASADHTVRLWNADTGQPLGDPLTGHTNDVITVAFSPAGRRIASGSVDNTVQLWDTDTGRPLGDPLAEDTMPVKDLAFSPDGNRVASASLDDTIRLWPATATAQTLCDKLTTNMNRQQWRDWVAPDIPYITVCPGLSIAPDAG